jgi:hypothetical protein
MNAEQTGFSPEFQQVLRVLPFTDEIEAGQFDLWCPDWDGTRDAGIVRGEEYADVALDVARRFQMPALLGCIIRDMVLCGRFGPVEAGFVAAISSAARVGAHH